ncbi:unnamed protein product, partial [Gongylonema pulchrum]|uniref:SprT-like domain-containing protein n=1 Tax=Gongylonema pulchrum TaxID=637853 RepID=A0A183EKT7_9BILA
MKRFIQQTGIPYISIKDRQHSISDVSETGKQNNSCEEEEISKKIHEESETVTEKEQECVSRRDEAENADSAVGETDKQNNSCEEEEISKKIHEESETITEKEQECLSRRDEVEKTDSAVGEETSQSSENDYSCRYKEDVSKWLKSVNASGQNSADEDLINSCFGAPLSPSSSSRRTSVSSLDGLLSPRRRINKSAEADANTSDAAATIGEMDLFGAPLSPSPAPESPARDTKSSGSITTSEVSEILVEDRPAVSCSTESVSFEANVRSASDQNSADEDLINSCFGAPLSPSSSSRRTSVSSLDGLLSPRRRINKSAEADANTSDAAAMIAETDLFGAPLSPSPAPESPAHDTKSSGSITTSEVSESLDVDRLAISCSTESVSFEANVQSEIGVSQIPTVSNTSEGPAVTKISKNSADTGKALNPAVLDNSEKSGVPGTVKDLAFSETSRDLSDSDTSKESVTPFASEDYSASTKLKNFAVLDVRKGKFSDTPKISTAAEVPEDFAAPDLSKSCSTTLDVSLKAKSSDSSVQHVIATPVSTVSLTHSLSIVIPRPRLRRISRRLDSQNDSESDSVWPTRSESRIPAQAEQVTEMLKKDAKQIQ